MCGTVNSIFPPKRILAKSNVPYLGHFLFLFSFAPTHPFTSKKGLISFVRRWRSATFSYVPTSNEFPPWAVLHTCQIRPLPPKLNVIEPNTVLALKNWTRMHNPLKIQPAKKSKNSLV